MKQETGKRALKSAKIKKVSLVDQVCEAIKQDIVDGVWAEGAKLPSEGEFAALYGVNRLSVRMALQKLSTLGVVETRMGEGSYVRVFSLRALFQEVAVFYKEKNIEKDVKQFRHLLECECLRLAIETATPGEIETLRHALDTFNAQLNLYAGSPGSERMLEKLVDADFAFHYQVVQMSHNVLYAEMYGLIKLLVRDHIRQLAERRLREKLENGETPPFASETHAKIYQAIVEADTSAARALIFEMLNITVQ